MTVNDRSCGTFNEKCIMCGTLNRIKKLDLYDRVLGVGVTKYSFQQYCESCRAYMGTWTGRDLPITPDGRPSVEFTFTPVRRTEVWVPTIYATPPRRHRLHR